MTLPWKEQGRREATRSPRLAQGAALALAAALPGACSPSSPAAADSQPPPQAVLAQGGAVYGQLCATCHFDGSGSPTAPSLVGSVLVKNSPDRMIAQILHGSQGAFKDPAGNEVQGLMPEQSSLSNDDIAAVVTFVRHQYGRVDQLTTPADVAKLR